MVENFQQMAELLLKSSLEGMNEAVSKKLEETETAFNAKLDGLKVALNEKIGVLESISGETPLTVTVGSVESPKTKTVHSAFMKIINILKSQKRIQKNIMMVGEAGSGKTHLASTIAEALGLNFYPMSVGLQTTKSDLLGFINAHGQYVTSPVREAFEKGGVLLLDEFDSTHAGVVTIINALLANGHCSFPDKIVEKNKNFICIVACNTYGHGANIDYVGRNRLDGATLDRFIVIDVGYDKKLEKALTQNDEWLEIVNKIRKNVEKQGIKMIISPRASMNGADLLEAGFKLSEVIDMCILKGADNDTRTKCLNGIDLKELKTESVKDISEYVRNLDKYQTFEIRTVYENFESIISYLALNDIIQSDLSGIGKEESNCERNLHFGNEWSPEFDGHQSIYFSTREHYRKDIGDAYKFSADEKDYVKDVFEWLAENSKIETPTPIAFEFIAKGCRKPWRVITVEAK